MEDDELQKRENDRIREMLNTTVEEKYNDYRTRMEEFSRDIVVGLEELKENHEKHKDAVMRCFVENGSCAPAYLVEEYRTILGNVSALHSSIIAVSPVHPNFLSEIRRLASLFGDENSD